MTSFVSVSVSLSISVSVCGLSTWYVLDNNSMFVLTTYNRVLTVCQTIVVTLYLYVLMTEVSTFPVLICFDRQESVYLFLSYDRTSTYWPWGVSTYSELIRTNLLCARTYEQFELVLTLCSYVLASTPHWFSSLLCWFGQKRGPLCSDF